VRGLNWNCNWTIVKWLDQPMRGRATFFERGLVIKSNEQFLLFFYIFSGEKGVSHLRLLVDGVFGKGRIGLDVSGC
jgi:hypothetical protein